MPQALADTYDILSLDIQKKKETFLQEFLLLPSFAADAVNKITRAL